VLSVYTTEPGIQFYGGNFLDGVKKGGKSTNTAAPSASNSALSEFCQHAQFPSTIFETGKSLQAHLRLPNHIRMIQRGDISMNTNRREFSSDRLPPGARHRPDFRQRRKSYPEGSGKQTVAAIGVGGSRGPSRKAAILLGRRAARPLDPGATSTRSIAPNSMVIRHKLAMYSDYRKMLEREQPHIVTIGTPDIGMCLSRSRRCTLARCVLRKAADADDNEGKRIRKVVKETGKVFQVARNSGAPSRRCSKRRLQSCRAAGLARR